MSQNKQIFVLPFQNRQNCFSRKRKTGHSKTTSSCLRSARPGRSFILRSSSAATPRRSSFTLLCKRSWHRGSLILRSNDIRPSSRRRRRRGVCTCPRSLSSDRRRRGRGRGVQAPAASEAPASEEASGGARGTLPPPPRPRALPSGTEETTTAAARACGACREEEEEEEEEATSACEVENKKVKIVFFLSFFFPKHLCRTDFFHFLKYKRRPPQKERIKR